MKSELDAVLALVGKATPREWEVFTAENAVASWPVVGARDEAGRIVEVAVTYGAKRPNAELITAAVNFLRAYGPALREALRDSERLDHMEATGWPGQFQADPTRPDDRRWFDAETAGSDYSPTLRTAIDAARKGVKDSAEIFQSGRED